MKKAVCLLALLTSPLMAWNEPTFYEGEFCSEYLTTNSNRNYFNLTARASYFLSTNKNFREIYGSGNVNWGLEVDVPIWRNLSAFLGVDYFTASGRSTLFHYHTRITMVPLSFGLQYSYSFMRNSCSYLNGLSLYGAFGGVYTPVIMKDNSPYVPQHRNRGGFGVIGRVGAEYRLCQCLFLDIFTDYTWQQLCYKNSDNPYVVGRRVDLSHFKFGGGFTYKF